VARIGIIGLEGRMGQALVNAICKLSEFGETHAGVLESIDVNPLVVREKGAVCLDAVITLRA